MGDQDLRNQYDSEDDGHEQPHLQHHLSSSHLPNGPASAAGNRRQQRQTHNAAAAAAAAALANSGTLDQDGYPASAVVPERGYGLSRRKAAAAAADAGGGSTFATHGVAAAASAITPEELAQLIQNAAAEGSQQGHPLLPVSSSALQGPLGSGSSADLASQRSSGGGASNSKVPVGKGLQLIIDSIKGGMAAGVPADDAAALHSGSTPAQIATLYQLLQSGGVLVGAASGVTLAQLTAAAAASPGGAGFLADLVTSVSGRAAAAASPEDDGAAMDGGQDAGGEEEDGGGAGLGGSRRTINFWTTEEKNTFIDVYQVGGVCGLCGCFDQLRCQYLIR